MGPQDFLQRRAWTSLAAAIAATLLVIYLASQYAGLPLHLQQSGSGIVLLGAACIFGIAALLYGWLFALMRFRYKPGLSTVPNKLVHRLSYREANRCFKVVIYQGGIWLTDEG